MSHPFCKLTVNFVCVLFENGLFNQLGFYNFLSAQSKDNLNLMKSGEIFFLEI